MTMHLCHCGEVHDSSFLCPQVFAIIPIDDWEHRLAEAFMRYMRAHDTFYRHLRAHSFKSDPIAFKNAQSEMNRAISAAEMIAREREEFPNLHLWREEDF